MNENLNNKSKLKTKQEVIKELKEQFLGTKTSNNYQIFKKYLCKK